MVDGIGLLFEHCAVFCMVLCHKLFLPRYEHLVTNYGLVLVIWNLEVPEELQILKGFKALVFVEALLYLRKILPVYLEKLVLMR